MVSVAALHQRIDYDQEIDLFMTKMAMQIQNWMVDVGLQGVTVRIKSTMAHLSHHTTHM